MNLMNDHVSNIKVFVIIFLLEGDQKLEILGFFSRNIRILLKLLFDDWRNFTTASTLDTIKYGLGHSIIIYFYVDKEKYE